MTERYRITEVLDEHEHDAVSRRRMPALAALRKKYAGVPG